jgi:hypothetical protein
VVTDEILDAEIAELTKKIADREGRQVLERVAQTPRALESATVVRARAATQGEESS